MFIETLSKRATTLRDTLKMVPGLTDQVDALNSLLPKLEALGPILEKIGDLDSKVNELAILEAVAPRLEALNQALEKINKLDVREPKAPEVKHENIEPNHDIARLQMLSKFAALVGKAKQIEEEWQKIQQDEHDAFFAFQVMKGTNDKEYAYKKGIADGIKWCVNHFC